MTQTANESKRTFDPEGELLLIRGEFVRVVYQLAWQQYVASTKDGPVAVSESEVEQARSKR